MQEYNIGTKLKLIEKRVNGVTHFETILIK